jgi:hypothetical protein
MATLIPPFYWVIFTDDDIAAALFAEKPGTTSAKSVKYEINKILNKQSSSGSSNIGSRSGNKSPY